MPAAPELAPSLPLPAPARRRRPLDWRVAAGLVGPVGVLLAWELLARAGAIPANWLPAPSIIAVTLRDLAASGELAGHLAATAGRVAAGFGLGAAVATVLGVVCGRSAVTRAFVDPGLQALRAVPSLAWVPLFLLWLGIGEGSKVALIALGAFFPVYLNLASGIQAIDPRWIEVGRVHGLSGWALARRVVLPAALPAFLTGLRGGLGLAWMFVVAAELMGASRGLGFLLVDGQATSRPELILATLLLFAAAGKASDLALVALGARWERWRADRTG